MDVITSSDRLWDQMEVVEWLRNAPCFVRPRNYPPETAGPGSVVIQKGSLPPVAVLNWPGRTFMPVLENPCLLGRRAVERRRQPTRVVFVDSHAEATSPWKPGRQGRHFAAGKGREHPDAPGPGLAK